MELGQARFRSFTVTFDDQRFESAEASRQAAERDMAAFGAVYEHLRRLDPGVRVICWTAACGGIPGKTRFMPYMSKESLAEYVRVVRNKLPKDVPVFRTGPGSLSREIEETAARQFADAAGRKVFLWDNYASRPARNGEPPTGRTARLLDTAEGYVANLNEKGLSWKDMRKCLRTLASIAMYTWNPEMYDVADLDGFDAWVPADEPWPGSRVAASTEATAVVRLFDQDTGTGWSSEGSLPAWIKRRFAAPRAIRRFAVQATGNVGGAELALVADPSDGSKRTRHVFRPEAGGWQHARCKARSAGSRGVRTPSPGLDGGARELVRGNSGIACWWAKPETQTGAWLRGAPSPLAT